MTSNDLKPKFLGFWCQKYHFYALPTNFSTSDKVKRMTFFNFFQKFRSQVTSDDLKIDYFGIIIYVYYKIFLNTNKVKNFFYLSY